MGEKGATLASLFDPQRNALNALRLLFALTVIVSHSWALGGFGDEPQAGGITLGTWSVLGFFGISGYLITRSRLSGRSAYRYYRARALRILPAFLVCLVFVAFVLAPLAAMLDESASWSPSEALTYVLRNAALYPPQISQEGIEGTLQGVPYVGMWNGSLWTLFWEGACYIAVGVAVSMLPRPALTKVAVVTVAAGALVALAAQTQTVSLPDLAGRVLPLVVAFLAGAVLFLYSDRLRVSALSVTAAIILLLASVILGVAQSVGVLPFVFLVMVVGSVLPLVSVGAKYDISYGVYIYAWPVQQVVFVLFGNDVELPGVIALSIAGTVPLAFLSCILIEQPVMRWGRGARRSSIAPLASIPE
jgi:peptidoglycan/LPS O-acetylase OafA/YrhL